jgi:hypothetical protein
LKVTVFFLLGYHAQLETAVEGLDERGCSFCDFFVDVVDFSLHGVEFLSEELDELVVFL